MAVFGLIVFGFLNVITSDTDGVLNDKKIETHANDSSRREKSQLKSALTKFPMRNV